MINYYYDYIYHGINNREYMLEIECSSLTIQALWRMKKARRAFKIVVKEAKAKRREEMKKRIAAITSTEHVYNNVLNIAPRMQVWLVSLVFCSR